MKLSSILLAGAVVMGAASFGSSVKAEANEALHVNDKPFLDLIGHLEGPDGYDDVLMGALEPEKPLTRMTIQEVLDHQSRMLEEGDGSAVGRYQFIRKTLKSTVERHGIDKGTLFNRVTQDFLARLEMEDCGFYELDKGARSLGHCLSQTWAALPDPRTGKSYYHGRRNKALTDVDTLVAALEERFQEPTFVNLVPASYEIADNGVVVQKTPLNITLAPPPDMSDNRFADAVPLQP